MKGFVRIRVKDTGSLRIALQNKHKVGFQPDNFVTKFSLFKCHASG